MIEEKKNDKLSKWIHILLLVYLISICVFLAYHAGFETAPDEGMKYQLIEYIAKHMSLPHGGNVDLINKIWGTTYAFTPYLSYIITSIFVRICMIFTSSLKVLVFVSRLTSLLFYVLYFEVIWLIAKKLFVGSFKYLFVVLCTFIPTIVYLGTYINTDTFSLFCVALIFLEWLNGIESNWNKKSCILLGIGLGLCFLSYYFYYGFILCSFFLYVLSNIAKKNSFKTFFKKGLLIFFVTFLVCGWWFIRQYKLYDGDIIGLRVSNEYSEKYADEIHKPTYLAENAKKKFQFDSWVLASTDSFFGIFRYNDIHYHYDVYCAFYLIMFFGLAFFIIKMVSKKEKEFDFPFKIESKFERIALYSCLLLAIIIPWFLSYYYSRYVDYQPQGRYLLSGCICLMVFVVSGYQYLLRKNKILKNIIVSFIIASFVLLPIYTYFHFLKGNIENKIVEKIK